MHAPTPTPTHTSHPHKGLIQKDNLHRIEELEAEFGGEECILQAVVEYELNVDSRD